MESTRSRLIKLLSENKMSYISGQALSEQLGISRNAIWKHMKDLESDGYHIDAKRSQGYRIVSFPDKVSSNTIRWGLETKWMGHHIIHKEATPSTQIIGHEAARDNAPDGTIIIAEEQTAGRGRMKKNWFSDKEGLWATLLLRPPIPPNKASELTLLTAVALRKALHQLTGLPIGIKWPNDLLIGDKKLCGILTEMQGEQDRINYVLIGIGLNVNQDEASWDASIRDIATSLKRESGNSWDKIKIVQTILKHFENTYEMYLNYGFKAIKSEWEEHAFKIDKNIKIKTFHEEWTGRFLGITDEGALIVESAEGSPVTLYSAEITWFDR
ncbi:biotin--[acetyl-CoA-carboxylase] ligase [Oceanobacillus sp. M60]|uniref:biotin--[acetyl-CoA-carboxylase] ligase n=1 Tax=Oceanobacillus oncorhynchi TaxID=545501 RepID=UPI0021171C08|nr:biotin--[acetyl-CoA-carboxylase] ligase [Oceanobacillus oncorhynchi]UUI38074.1 biotin--[acetyl-CoA-carboxylase] ligase [Oceanobacillus oncorhynchi]